MDRDVNSSDSNEWELSKENVQPLKQGRKVAPLTAALAPNSFDYQSKIHKEKQFFESEIRTYEGEDFLDVWYRYILWMAETFPTGGADMVQLLERCIALFKDQEQYRDDERYLKVWIRYADLCTDPSEIFNYMYSQDMFSVQALFYEAWAEVLESKGDNKRADEVYNLGIQRNAQPLERLKRQLRAFETRLAESIHMVGEISDQGRSQADVKRTALGGLKATKKGKVGVKRIGNATLGCTGGIGQVGQQPNSRASFSVFVDEAPSQGGSQLPAAAGNWHEPPTQSTITRENTQKPGKWTSHQKKQPSIPLDSTNQRPDFMVHVDESALHTAHTPQPSFVGMNGVLSSRKPGKGVSHDPLKNINKADKSSNADFKVMYCKEKIYAGVEEYSLEEIRAASIFASIRNGTWSKPKTNDQPTPKVKEMYPKKEVYNFVAELQWEEVRAKHYFAKLAQRHSVPSAPKAHEVQMQPVAIDVGSINQSAALQGSRESGHFKEAQFGSSSGQDVAARRELSFSSTGEQDTTATHNASERAVHQPAPLNSSGLGSAFRPVQRSLGEARPLCSFVSQQDTSISSSRGGVAHGEDNESRTGAGTSGYAAPTHVTSGQPVRTPDSQLLQRDVTISRELLAASSAAALSVHSPDGRNESNSSWLCGPSPTVNTRQAMAEVMAMFNNPLEADDAGISELDKEFEDQFDNPGEPLSGLGGATKPRDGQIGGLGFMIYDETAANTKEENEEHVMPEEENKENRPTAGYHQLQHQRVMTGVLQPALGFPVSTEDIVEDAALDDPPVVSGAAITTGRASDALLTEEAECTTTFSGNFSTMARMASTPFCAAVNPPSLPHLPCSTIRPSLVDTQPFSEHSEDDRKADNPSDGYATFVQGSGSFMCTPNKVLSPIMEKSNESATSRASQSSGSEGGVGHHTIVGVSELSQIHEEPNTSRGNPDEPVTISTKHEGSVDLNPFSNEVQNLLVSRVQPAASSYEGFFQCERDLPRIAPGLAADLGTDDLFRVRSLTGSGAFAKVFKATKINMDSSLTDYNWDEDLEVAIKVSRMPTTWEFYVCRQLHERIAKLGLPAHTHGAFMNPSSLYIYADGCVLVDQYLGHGTLLDTVNKYKSACKTMSQSMAVYYTIELLKIVENAHRCDIIHGDIKPDNFLVVDGDEEGAPCLRLIDFGRSIDLQLFPAGTSFTVDCHTDTFQCIEMRKCRPWTTQVDMYGLLATVHCVIHGEYMNVYEEGGRWHPTKTIKRHWNTRLWNKLYDTLLNIPNCQEQPSLRGIRHEFEEFHQATLNIHNEDKKRHDVLLFNMTTKNP